MRKDRENAVRLRKEGKSYAQISSELGVSKATLSTWFSKEAWSEGVRRNLVQVAKTKAARKMRSLNEARGTRLEHLYGRAKKEAVDDLAKLRYDPLFIAGTILYWGSGDRTTKHHIRFSSADMEKVTVFIRFLENLGGVGRERMRASLMVYPGQDEQSNRRFWAFGLGPGITFTKSSVVPGSFDARRLSYGICTITVSSAYLKVKMLEWLKILPKQLIEER